MSETFHIGIPYLALIVLLDRASQRFGRSPEELPELSSMQIVLFDVLRKDGDVDDEWTVLQESEKLDAYSDRQEQEMGVALEYLKRFRQDIANELESTIA